MRMAICLLAGLMTVTLAKAEEPAKPRAAAGFVLDGEKWTYRDDSLSFDGILVKPTGSGPFPAILISHGMGGSAGSFGMTKAKALVQAGFVCIAPNYTHSREAMGDRRRGQRPAANDPKGPGASEENVRRAEKCLEILASLPYVDQRRVNAYGHSMGGFVTIALAAKVPTRLSAAAISGSGIAAQAGFAAPSAEEAKKIRTPFCMIHGDADRTVPPERSAMLKEILDQNRVPCERHVFAGVNHPVDQEKSAEVMALLKAWFGRFPAKK